VSSEKERLYVEHSFRLDEENSTVWARVTSATYKDAFMLFVDVTRPIITFDATAYDDTGSVVPKNQDIPMRFKITDNVDNVAWDFLYARGNEAYTNSDTGKCDSSGSSVIVTIPGALVGESYGVRALVLLSDALNGDTINVSKRIRCVECDAFYATNDVWSPVSSATELDNASASYVLASLAQDGHSLLDTSWVRLFRWAPCKNGDDCHGKWEEYADGDESDFEFRRGRVFWLKTREQVNIKVQHGKTTSLKESYSILLKAGNWNDVALPVKFNVMLKDIINENGSDAEQLQFIKWTFENKEYSYEEMYSPDIPGFEDSIETVMLKYQAQKEPYSIYVPGDDDIYLKIPPTPPELSGTSLAKSKKVAEGGWSVKVISSAAGHSVNELWCGFVPGSGGVTYYPVRPSFSRLRASFADKKGKLWSHAMAHDVSSGGAAFELVYANEYTETAEISFKFEPGKSMPEDMTVRLFSAETGEFAPEDATYSVKTGPNAKERLWVVAGTSEFQKNFISSFPGFTFFFAGVRPNPVTRQAAIMFRVPSSGVDELNIAIHDMKGRIVWTRSMQNQLNPGTGRILWDRRDSHGRPVAAGVYLVRLSVREKGMVKFREFKARMMCL
jgi:hypothetical protein